ncbi:MAG: tetratricopeptide repeat protein [Planctomycetes bacterium]|nr:tetratricopeptide repeat protein [Planctomycetota bacterium]
MLVRQLDPRAAHVLPILLVVACLSAGRSALAQVTAKTLIGKAVSDDSEYNEINNAITRFGDRDIDGCRAILERARNNNPKLPPPGVMMAMLWLNANQLMPARGELEQTTVKFPKDPEPYLMLADLAFQDRRVTDSAVLFERATELSAGYDENPKRKRDFEIRCHAGNAAVAEARSEWAAAQKHLESWITLDPDNAGAHFRLGSVLFQAGKEKEALAEFQEARKLDAKALQPELAIARLYDDARKKDVAKKWIESALKAAPEDPAVLLAAAQWYLGQNDIKTSQAITDKVLTLDPKSLDGRIVRGVIARVARDYATAAKYFNEAHVQSPGNFAASNSLSLVLIESDEKDSQQRALEMAEANVARYRENSPQQVNALTTLAWVYYKLGRREDTEKILDQIARNNALTSDGAYYVAKLLADRGEKDRAKKILEEVLTNEAVFATRPDAKDLLEGLKGSAKKE